MHVLDATIQPAETKAQYQSASVWEPGAQSFTYRINRLDHRAPP